MPIMSTAGKENNVFGRIPSINEVMLLRDRGNWVFVGCEISLWCLFEGLRWDVPPKAMLDSGTEGYRIVT